MSQETRLAAFVEYVIRPLSEDWRIIIEKLIELKFPLTPDLIKRTTIAIGLWNITGEIIRATSYILVTWIICQTIKAIWPLF